MDGMVKKSFENSFYEIELFSVLGTNEAQEDVVACQMNSTSAILVLCDGMGGLKNGRIAAQTAVDEIVNLVQSVEWNMEPIAFMRRAIEIADEKVYFLKDSAGSRLGAGCTVLIALIAGRKVYYANVGDSRIYYYDGNEFIQVSQDHNYGEMLKSNLASGEISMSEYEQELPKAAALTGFLGLGVIKECYIAQEPILLDRGQVLCMQSDGLYKLVDDESMKSVISRNIKDLKQAGEELLDIAESRRKKYQDNTSIILVRLK